MPLQPARLRPWLAAIKRILFSVVLLCGGHAYAQSQQTSNSFVAVVNAEPITRKALSDACVVRYGVDVMDSMINRHLILQACQQQGIEVTNENVRDEIQRQATTFGLSVDSYLQLFQEERDISPESYSREVVWPMLALRKLVADQVEPSQDEINKAMIAQYGEAVKCRMIMTDNPQKANDIRAQALANPTQFGTLAKSYSNDESSASVGGLIPPIRRYTGDSRIEDAAFALANNEISKVLQLGDQWIVLQAVRRIRAEMPSAKALPAITERIKDRIRDQKLRPASSKLFLEMQQKAKVVKVLGDPKLEQQYPGVAAVVNGQQVSISAVAAECVKRHGKDVLQGEINRKLLVQALRKSKQQVAQADIQAEMVRAAQSFGIVRANGEADLAAWIESVTSDGQTTRAIYESDAVWPSVALRKLVEGNIQITQEDVIREFESSYGPRVEVMAIVLPDQRTAQKVWKMARDNPSEQFFAKLAEQYSIEPSSASNRGKVPPIRKYGGQPKIEEEAFGLKAGELSSIVVTGDRYILLRCLGRTNPVVTDIEAVRSELMREIHEKKLQNAMAREFDRLKDSAQIDDFFTSQTRTRSAAAKAPAVK